MLGLVIGFSSLIAAQQTTSQQAQSARPQSPPMRVEHVKGNIFQVTGGSGANTGFVVGEKEVIVIDAKMTEESAAEMLKEIKKVTPLPVRRVILTHSDGDHVNGLTGFPDGVDVIAHENARVQVAAAFRQGNQRKYIPNITFTDKLFIYPDDDSLAGRIELLWFGPAHTDGDAVVCFPEEKIAFAGDLIFLGRDPLIHRSKNGSSFGLVKVVKAILDLDVDTILSGHNQIVTKDSLRKFIAGVEDKQSRIAAMVKEGKTLDEVKAEFRVDSQPGRSGPSRWPSLVEVIFLELTQKK